MSDLLYPAVFYGLFAAMTLAMVAAYIPPLLRLFRERQIEADRARDQIRALPEVGESA